MASLRESVSPVATVKPRTPKHDARHLLIYDGERVLVERTGEVHPASRFPFILLHEEPAIVICENAPRMLVPLNNGICGQMGGWQFKTTLVKRTKFHQRNRAKPTTIGHLVVSWFGWKSLTNRASHYHYPVDPMVMTGCAVHRLIPHEADSEDTLQALLAWGTDMREWCQQNGLKVSSSAGSLAIQLLTDPRFYPKPRRKVPRATNDRARPHLVGNHYELHTEPYIFHSGAYYLDMASAHHYCASNVILPDANSLNARGLFREPLDPAPGELTPVNPPAWLQPHDRQFKDIVENSYGLLQLRVEGLRPYEKFTFPFLRKYRLQTVWIYTNEVPLIRELGGYISGMDAAWTSWHPDTGIPKYAEWAMTENETMTPQRKQWCKPALLAPYGMLAHRPSAPEIGYHHSEGGIRQPIPVPGGGSLEMNICQTGQETESRIANVIQRGIIEAEVRVRVIQLARELDKAGLEVLGLYADSVIVDSKNQLPPLPEPWRVKTLTQFEYFNRVSFQSKEMVKLPGIADRLDEDRISRVKAMAAFSGQRNRLRERG